MLFFKTSIPKKVTIWRGFILCLYLRNYLRTQGFLNNEENPLFSQVPFKGKLGRRASPGREKNPGAKHTGVRDFTPTTVPTLPKKLINSILGTFGGGEHSGSPFSATIISFSNVAQTILPLWHHGVRGVENLSPTTGNRARTAHICAPQKVCPSLEQSWAFRPEKHNESHSKQQVTVP